MSEPTASDNPAPRSNLLWLDRLTMSVPGYGGYSSQHQRRAAAFALRDAVLRRLVSIHEGIEQAKRSCQEQDAHVGVASLERLEQHLDRIIDRVKALGTRIETFYTGPDLELKHVAPIHGADFALLNKADAIVRHFEHPQPSHNLLADLEGDLNEFEGILDGRALMLYGLEKQRDQQR